jgi:hypothetical protein
MRHDYDPEWFLTELGSKLASEYTFISPWVIMPTIMVERYMSEVEQHDYSALVAEMTGIIKTRVRKKPTHQAQGRIPPYASYLMTFNPLTDEASIALFTNDDASFEEEKRYVLRNPTIKEGSVRETVSYSCELVSFGTPTPEDIENLGDDEYWEDALVVGIDELRMVSQIVRNPSEGYAILSLLPKLRTQVWG